MIGTLDCYMKQGLACEEANIILQHFIPLVFVHVGIKDPDQFCCPFISLLFASLNLVKPPPHIALIRNV